MSATWPGYDAWDAAREEVDSLAWVAVLSGLLDGSQLLLVAARRSVLFAFTLGPETINAT